MLAFHRTDRLATTSRGDELVAGKALPEQPDTEVFPEKRPAYRVAHFWFTKRPAVLRHSGWAAVQKLTGKRTVFIRVFLGGGESSETECKQMCEEMREGQTRCGGIPLRLEITP